MFANVVMAACMCACMCACMLHHFNYEKSIYRYSDECAVHIVFLPQSVELDRCLI